MKHTIQTLRRFVTPFGAALFAVAAPASAQTWIASTSGQWNDPANWNPQIVPNAVGAEAFFASTIVGGTIITQPFTVGMATPITLGHLSVDLGVGSSFFFMNPSELTLDNGGGADVSIFTTATGGFEIAGQIVLMGNLVTDWRADNGFISATISGDYGIIIDSPQSFRSIRLAGVNTYTGDTVVRSGRLRFESPLNLGDPAGATIVEADGTLILNNLSEPVISGMSLTLMDGGRIWTRPATWDDTITLVGAGEIAPWFDGFEALVSGQLTGDATFIRGSAQSFFTTDPTMESILNVTNTANDYTGGTIIRSGVLRIPGDDALGAPGTGITFETVGFSEGPGAIVTTEDTTIARDILLLSDGWLRAEAGTTAVYPDVISGNRALSIGFLDWTGVVELRGDNQFTIGATVRAGTLLVRNTTGSATGTGPVVVESGALLAGDGAISNIVTIQGGAALAPGPDAATLAVGAATFQTDAEFSIEIGGVDPGEFDRLSVNFTATLGGHLSASIINEYTPVEDDEIEILTAATVNGEFDTLDLPDGFVIDYFADRVVLRFTSVGSPCLGDTNGDGAVNSADLGNLLSCWGAVPPESVCESSDLNGDGNVNSQDLGALLGSWGVCP